jgi:ferredoxin
MIIVSDTSNTIGNTGLRVIVDPRRCVANGKCTYAAPGVYVIDEETGVAYVDDEDRATVENLFAGARACPTDAISIEQYGRRVYPQILPSSSRDRTVPDSE